MSQTIIEGKWQKKTYITDGKRKGIIHGKLMIFTQANNETGVALCNGVYASESAACSEDSASCNNTKKKADLAKEVPGTANKIMIMIITRITIIIVMILPACNSTRQKATLQLVNRQYVLRRSTMINI